MSGDLIGSIIVVIKGDARSLHHGSSGGFRGSGAPFVKQ